ncbi:SDR family NAD(P)-dependent oxidoreductase [Paenibacillus sp. CF384]|uniref:SDR family NAD(P)-dependent oxidoreductase n=1 Tax=Paenibacillus sp. CF384 TaxID=1884382 RepID=UPI00089721FB|nr:SDR family oxidoreductase [Paenibacillus sp. CF384]SDW10160.1 NAD(P)-dependent dehydrogenase, short-chain alcohol dehydrogenase family [Paenibacillus sp. CF384]
MGIFDGKVAVVTGGTSGIGHSSAQMYVKEGAHVFITGRRQAELDEALKLLGKNATGVQGDISKSEDIDKLFDIVEREKGKLDFLLANAGIGSLVPLLEITEEHYYKTFDVNVKGTLFTVKKALSLFPNQTGSIMIVGSLASSPAFSVYGGTKEAIRQMVRSWIQELRGTQIRVNVIQPGFINTPAYEQLFGKEVLPFILEGMAEKTPLGRVGTPEDIAKAVKFLSSDDSAYVNGIDLTVDGGSNQY